MTVLENVATTTIVNLFNSNNREEYKTKAVFNFLISCLKKSFDEIEEVGEQKAGDSKNTIPDFFIQFKRMRKTYEVKINNSKLTEAEKVSGNRDVFLIPRNYKYKDEIIGKIIYWEDLFDELDNNDISIDGLDKIRQVINYTKIDITAKIYETLLYLKSFYPKIDIDLRNIIISNKGKVDIEIPLFPKADETSELKLILNNDELKVETKDKNIEIMKYSEFKIKHDCSVLAQDIYDKLYNYLPTKIDGENYHWDASFNNLYENSLNKLEENLKKYADNEDKGVFWYSETQYIYYCKGLDNKGKVWLEIGFGHIESKKFSKQQIENLKNIREIIIKEIKDMITIKFRFNNVKWVGVRFYCDKEIKDDAFETSLLYAFKYAIKELK